MTVFFVFIFFPDHLYIGGKSRCIRVFLTRIVFSVQAVNGRRCDPGRSACVYCVGYIIYIPRF